MAKCFGVTTYRAGCVMWNNGLGLKINEIMYCNGENRCRFSATGIVTSKCKRRKRRVNIIYRRPFYQKSSLRRSFFTVFVPLSPSPWRTNRSWAGSVFKNCASLSLCLNTEITFQNVGINTKYYIVVVAAFKGRIGGWFRRSEWSKKKSSES